MKIILKIIDILSPPERKRALYLLILISFSALLEMLGVASIIPFISIVINPNFIETNNILNIFYQTSKNYGILNITQFLFIISFFVFFLFIFTLITRALVQYAHIRFSLMREFTISKRLFENYLNKSYQWFINSHSANISKNILSEVGNVVGGVIMPIFVLISHSLVVLTITILLIFVDPILALSVGFFLIFTYACIIFFIKKINSRLSYEFHKANKDRFTVVLESLGAIKEIKVWGLEKYYINNFKKPAEIYANAQSLATIFNYMPRYIIEGISFGGIILLIIFLIGRGDEFIKTISIVAVYVFAGYRLLPALQSIYVSFLQIRFSKASLDLVHSDLVSLKSLNNSNDNSDKMLLKNSIILKNINFNYSNIANKNFEKKTLKNVNLTIPAVGKVAIIGKSGSGKSTIVDIILGLLDPDSGNLIIDENIINNYNKRSWQKNLGYVPQRIYLSNNSIASNIAFGKVINNTSLVSIEEAAKIANIHDFIIEELPNKYQTIIGERGINLSLGQCQRLGIARAIYRKPRVLILDEATSALDSYTEKKVIESLESLEKDMLIIFVTHRLNTIKDFNYIFLLEKGNIIAQGDYNYLIKNNYKNLIK